MSKIYIHEDFLWRTFSRNNPALPPRRKARTARRWAEAAHQIAEYLKHYPAQKAAELRRWAGIALASEKRWEKLPPGYRSPFGRDAMAVKARPGVEDHALRILAEVVIDIYYFHGHAPTGENEPYIVRWDEYFRAPYPVPTRRQYDAWRAIFPLTAGGMEGMESEWSLIVFPGAYCVQLHAGRVFRDDPISHRIMDGKMEFAGQTWVAERFSDSTDEIVLLTRDYALDPVSFEAVRDGAKRIAEEENVEVRAIINDDEGCSARYLEKQEIIVAPASVCEVVS